MAIALSASDPSFSEVDLVIAAGERNVRAPADLLAVVEASSLGDPLQLKVLRGSEQMELSIEPAPLPMSQAG